ncbi:MAG: protein phosphatase 2C domain-containing protein [Magnetococcales bacterium]|nr:protein phosphatase 2C domain-containing protein [Magnetococcales bacterium]
MPEYTLSNEMFQTLYRLIALIKEEEVPDPGVGQAPVGLSTNARKVFFLLDKFKRELDAAKARRREPLVSILNAPDKTAGGKPTLQAANSPPARPASPPCPAPDPMAGANMPALGYNGPFPPAEVPMTAEMSPKPPAIRDTVSVPVAVVQSGATPPASSPEPAAKPSLDTPQPGGAPAMPVRSPFAEKIAVMPIETVKKIVYLKNARANEPYEGAVEIDGIKGLKLENAGGSGLALDQASGLLKGTPMASGDFVVRLQGLLHGKRCEVVANLAVIPDPKSLWVSKDSDRSDPFWKPDEAFDRVDGDLLCVAASKRGRSHAKEGTFRDDDFGLLANGPGGWHIAVVADGAGSARFSRRGSKVAVDSVLRDLSKLLEDHVTPELGKLVPAYLQNVPGAVAGIKRQLYQSLAMATFNAAKAIDAEAAAMGEKSSAFSTTLIVGVACKISEGWFVAGFSVGDGGAAVLDVRDGSLTTLTLPDSGEFAGQTRFLQKSEFSGGFDEVAKRIFFDVRKEFTAIALMTDGISDPKFPTDSVFADPARWVEFWEGDLTKAVDLSRGNKKMQRQLLEWLDFWSPGNHDDRTLAVLVP